jgi:hypothetical protein
VGSIYYKAAAFSTQLQAKLAYVQLVDVLKVQERLNVSAYNYFHLERMKWCVVVLGEQPSSDLDTRFLDILSSGEIITLNESEMAKLNQRREEKKVPGKFVYKHHRKGKRM